MASKATPHARQEEQPLNMTEIRALVRMVQQYDLSELELELEGRRLRIRRERGGGTAVPVAVPLPSSAATLPPAVEPRVSASAAAPEPADDGSTQISSPFVGTFYRAPSPESPPFVEEGQRVKKGQVLCIVEAMKLMNEIEADMECKILEILVKNAEPVEFGQPLFRVQPLP